MLRYFIPFFLIYVAYAVFPYVLARGAGTTHVPYNASFEGAKILAHRKAVVEEGGNVPFADIYFAGSSRTMAAFSAASVAVNLQKKCGLKKTLTAYNLGNISNYYDAFLPVERLLPREASLVLEFSPHILLQKRTVKQKQDGWFYSYAFYKEQAERFVSGRVFPFLGLQERMLLFPESFSRLSDAFRQDRPIYYALRTSQDTSQVYQPDGQVTYFNIYPDREIAERFQDHFSVLTYFKTRKLNASRQDAGWKAFKELVQARGARLVVVRPPVDAEMYVLENDMAGTVVRDVTAFLKQQGVPYIDLNEAGDFHSTDMSHIDWYETPRVAAALSQKISCRLFL